MGAVTDPRTMHSYAQIVVAKISAVRSCRPILRAAVGCHRNSCRRMPDNLGRMGCFGDLGQLLGVHLLRLVLRIGYRPDYREAHVLVGDEMGSHRNHLVEIGVGEVLNLGQIQA